MPQWFIDVSYNDRFMAAPLWHTWTLPTWDTHDKLGALHLGWVLLTNLSDSVKIADKFKGGGGGFLAWLLTGWQLWCNLTLILILLCQSLQYYGVVRMILTHWGRVTHICVNKLTIIGSDNGLEPGRRQAIIWTNAEILLIGPLGTNFSEIVIDIWTFSFKKMQLKMSGKWQPSCLGRNVLTDCGLVMPYGTLDNIGPGNGLLTVGTKP